MLSRVVNGLASPIPEASPCARRSKDGPTGGICKRQKDSYELFFGNFTQMKSAVQDFYSHLSLCLHVLLLHSVYRVCGSINNVQQDTCKDQRTRAFCCSIMRLPSIHAAWKSSSPRCSRACATVWI